MFPIISLNEVDSTNNYLKGLLTESLLAEFTVVRTDFQLAGRGQRDSDGWESENGKNLLFSIVLYPKDVAVDEQFIISQLVALSIKDTLSEYVDGITIKWPNDIYWNDKKICGTLIENSLVENRISQSVVGIGVNVNQQKFNSKAPNPVSLWQIINQDQDCLAILDSIITKIKSNYENLIHNRELVKKKYKNSLYRKDGLHKYADSQGVFEAKIKDISTAGYLELEDKSETVRRYAFKEVRYIQ